MKKKMDVGKDLPIGNLKSGITHRDLKKAIVGIATGFDNDLFSKKKEELEEYWHFKFDEKASLEKNMYHFYDMLRLYSSFCRRWEEKHNGSCCVVERVRDEYIMPKIKGFAKNVRGMSK